MVILVVFKGFCLTSTTKIFFSPNKPIVTVSTKFARYVFGLTNEILPNTKDWQRSIDLVWIQRFPCNHCFLGESSDIFTNAQWHHSGRVVMWQNGMWQNVFFSSVLLTKSPIFIFCLRLLPLSNIFCEHNLCF